MKRTPRNSLDSICRALVLIREKPRTNPELQELMLAKWDTVNSWILTLEKNKLIRFRGLRKIPKGMPPSEYEAT